MSGGWLLLVDEDESLSGRLAWDCSHGMGQSSKRAKAEMCETFGGPGSEAGTLPLLSFLLATSSHKANLLPGVGK